MNDLANLQSFFAGILRPIVKQIVDETLRQQGLSATPANALASGTQYPPLISSKQVREMTGWPNGTFYLKVSQMPEGVVIRGKSKRLLFNREKLMEWLTTPKQP